MHLFGRDRDHDDYQFELLAEEERGCPSLSRWFTAHHGDFRAAPRANRTRPTADNPILGAASSTDKPTVVAPSPPWRSSVPAASCSDSFLPSLLVGQCHQLYSGRGADIVMESLRSLTSIECPARRSFREALFYKAEY